MLCVCQIHPQSVNELLYLLHVAPQRREAVNALGAKAAQSQVSASFRVDLSKHDQNQKARFHANKHQKKKKDHNIKHNVQ